MGSGAVTNSLASAVCAIDCGSVRLTKSIVFTSTRCACSAFCIRFAIAISAVACLGVSTVKVGHQWQCRVGVLMFWSVSQINVRNAWEQRLITLLPLYAVCQFVSGFMW